MSPHFKSFIQGVCLAIFFLLCAAVLSSCTTTTDILAGSDGACGTLHIEGSFTDSQGDVIIFKVPEGWTAEQVKDLCPQ